MRDYSAVDFDGEFCFIGKTDEENSLVCITENVPDNVVERSDGWRAFRISGILDFSLTGVLSSISALLAGSDIGVFAISTFNTDYILTRGSDYEKALDVLASAGYIIS